jgi:hypothetical protein
MRPYLILMVLGFAAPAVAQPYFGLAQARDARAAADAMAARNRDIALANELAVLQARLQSDEALSNIRAARVAVTLPRVALDPNTPLAVIDTGKLAAIPDETLAQSNARVLAAAANRR